MSRRRFLLACAAGVMTLGAHNAQGQEHALCRQRNVSTSVHVYVYDGTVVPVDILRYAKAYATEVYKRIGVVLHWNGDNAVPAGRRPPYTLVLMTSKTGNAKGTDSGPPDDVVGQAVAVARRAYVYYDRVAGMAQPPDRDLVTFLGYVMAHELGHLMLPGGRHAVAGIMRGSFPLRSRSADTFTAVEARLICVRLDQEASD